MSEKVVKSAVCIIPPKELWEQINSIRKEHDKAYPRWPPHVNLLYPFYPSTKFDSISNRAAKFLEDFQPFTMKLSEFGHFVQGKGVSAVWLDPQSNPKDAVHLLQSQLQSAFPDCDDLSSRKGGFHPHLSVGQSKTTEVNKFKDGLKNSWKDLEFTVDRVYFISREGFDDPFQVDYEIPFRTGVPVKRTREGETTSDSKAEIKVSEEYDPSEVKATLFDLGDLGTVVKLNLGKAPVREKKWSWKDIVVLDVSGSMGHHVSTIVKVALPQTFQKLGLSETESIHLVAFETFCHYSLVNRKLLEGSTMKCMGGTTMGPAIKKVQELLINEPYTPFRILIVSDGAIDDKATVKQIASSLPEALIQAGRTAPVSVCSIRAMTSHYADPDTQAMVALGQLNSTGNISLIDVNGALIEAELGTKASEAFEKNGSAGSNLHEVSCSEKGIVRLPGSEGVAEIAVVEGTSTILLKPGLSFDSLSVNGIPLKEEQVTRIKDPSEDDIHPLLLFIESQAKQLMVLGASEEKLKSIFNWVSSASQVLVRKEEKVEEVQNANKYSFVMRRKNLIAKLDKVETSVLQRIKELASLGRVSNLNSERQADFLKGVGTGSKGRALARRAGKVDTADIEQVVPDEVTKLREKLCTERLEESKEEPASFYSHETFSNCLNALPDMKVDEIELLSASEIMQFIGPVGISYQAKQNDAPDPWSCFYANNVFVGDSTVLNSADLWASKSQSGSDLKAPGTELEINGVLPVRAFNPKAFDTMMELSPTLLKLHVAAGLRGSLVAMPGDLGAVAASCAVKLANQLAGQSLEATAKVLQFVIKDLHYYSTEKKWEMGLRPEIVKAMNEGDPRTVMAGDVFIASELKPFGGILGGMVNPSPKVANAILSYSYYLAFNRRFNEPQDRLQVLSTLLGLKEELVLNPGAPFTPDPEKIFHTEGGLDLNYLNSLFGDLILKSISAVFAAREAFDPKDSPNDFQKKFSDVLRGGEDGIVPKFFGKETVQQVKELAGVLALQSLQANSLSARIEVDETAGTRVFKLPELDDEKAAREFIQEQIGNAYEERYEAALKKKREEERFLGTARLVHRMIKTDNLKEYIDMLGEGLAGHNRALIYGRDSEGFTILSDRLLMDEQVPIRAEKIWVLVLGRDLDEEPVWCQGNSLRGNWHKFFQCFEKSDSVQLWERLKEVHAKYNKHVYREGAPNRHGHSNDFPSFWALGYNDLDSFNAADPEACKSYVEARLKAGKLWAQSKWKGRKEEITKMMHASSIK